MDYTISEIARIIGAKSSFADPDSKISRLLTDSRSLTYPDGTLFFALATTSGDGHRYIGQLYERGVRNFVVTDAFTPSGEMKDANILRVESTLAALQTLAAHHRRRYNIPVVAVTGSRGKTTVKEWLNQLLQADMEIIRSPRSYNSQIGVPLSVWQLTDETALGIFEAGISQPGEMARLKEILAPEIGIFTNIGPAHSAGFESIEQKCREKALLLDGCRCTIYNADDPLVSSCVKKTPESIGWSRKNPEATLYISEIKQSGGKTRFRYTYNNTSASGKVTDEIEIPFVKEQELENAVDCLAVMLALNVPAEKIRGRMAALTPVGTRLEVIEGVGGSLLIHDNYTSDFNSLAPALDFMKRRMPPDCKAAVIVSDLMHDADADLSDLYSRMAATLAVAGVSRVIGIGPELMAHKACFKGETEFFASTEEFLAEKEAGDFSNELVLIKGAPSFGFDRICELLEARQHETVLEINLDAVVSNFNAFRSRIKPTTAITCMIKASGYGAGSHELARTLQAQGASYLAVAVHDEGADLRRAGITMPILVLNPTVENFHALFADRLEPEIYSFDFLKALIREAKRYGVKDYPVHIKIDSGMHRLGFLKEDLPALIELLKSQDNVVPRSIFSHLCAADDPQEDDYTRMQFRYFDECCAILTAAFPERKIMRHILNSTGITRFPEHQLDMVRLGIGLYGVKTMHDGSQDDLRPVSSLNTVIISLKHWPEGTTIGYNRRGVLKRESVIATIPVGYADGINRHFGYGNTSVMVNGVKCPTVGSICMDACMIDVTDVPDVRTGDRVEIFGENIPVDDLAEVLGTIPYEVLTSVSQRVKRVYYRE